MFCFKETNYRPKLLKPSLLIHLSKMQKIIIKKKTLRNVDERGRKQDFNWLVPYSCEQQRVYCICIQHNTLLEVQSTHLDHLHHCLHYMVHMLAFDAVQVTTNVQLLDALVFTYCCHHRPKLSLQAWDEIGYSSNIKYG